MSAIETNRLGTSGDATSQIQLSPRCGRIGYLVPEFPGQTHTFFWRELLAFDRANVPIDVVSSRFPNVTIAAHSWTETARQRTAYLHPPKQIHRTFLHLLTHPIGVAKCLSTVIRAECDGIGSRCRMLLMIFYAAELSRIARAKKWVHLHCHMCSDVANLALLANRLSGVPYSLTLHAPLSDFGMNQKQKWRFSRFGIAITQSLLTDARTELGDSAPKQIEIVPMGVDVQDFVRDLPYVPHRDGEPLNIFSCGRLNPCKGHATIIEAVALLRRQGLDTRLSIAGEDQDAGMGYRKELERLILQLDVESAVTLLGAIPEEQVRQHLEECHCFVLASKSEPFGIAIAEAMAMETPTIATSAGGVCEWVDDGYDCILVPPEAPEKLAEAIADLARNPNRCLEIGKHGRQTVVSRYGSHRSAEVLLRAIGVENWKLVPTIMDADDSDIGNADAQSRLLPSGMQS